MTPSAPTSSVQAAREFQPGIGFGLHALLRTLEDLGVVWRARAGRPVERLMLAQAQGVDLWAHALEQHREHDHLTFVRTDGIEDADLVIDQL